MSNKLAFIMGTVSGMLILLGAAIGGLLSLARRAMMRQSL